MLFRRNPTEEDEELFEEFLEGYEDLPADELNRLVPLFELEVEPIEFDNGTVWKLQHGEDRYILNRGEKDGLYSASTVEGWLENATMSAEDYVTHDDGLGEFWIPSKHPLPPLYHATDSDNVESILEEGIGVRDETRGMANRMTGAAVFTSFEQSAIDVYGDSVFEINTTAMRDDGVHPRLSIEPGIRDYEEMTAVRHAVGLDEDDFLIEMPDTSEDYDTVIVYGSIPPKYLKLLE